MIDCSGIIKYFVPYHTRIKCFRLAFIMFTLMCLRSWPLSLVPDSLGLGTCGLGLNMVLTTSLLQSVYVYSGYFFTVDPG